MWHNITNGNRSESAHGRDSILLVRMVDAPTSILFLTLRQAIPMERFISGQSFLSMRPASKSYQGRLPLFWVPRNLTKMSCMIPCAAARVILRRWGWIMGLYLVRTRTGNVSLVKRQVLRIKLGGLDEYFINLGLFFVVLCAESWC